MLPASEKSISLRCWTQVLRTLTVLLNSSLTSENRAFALRLCCSDAFQRMVNKFLLSTDLVGPVLLKAFSDFLSRIQIVYQAVSDEQQTLADMLLGCLHTVITRRYDRLPQQTSSQSCCHLTHASCVSASISHPLAPPTPSAASSSSCSRYQPAISARRPFCPYSS